MTSSRQVVPAVAAGELSWARLGSALRGSAGQRAPATRSAIGLCGNVQAGFLLSSRPVVVSSVRIACPVCLSFGFALIDTLRSVTVVFQCQYPARLLYVSCFSTD